VTEVTPGSRMGLSGKADETSQHPTANVRVSGNGCWCIHDMRGRLSACMHRSRSRRGVCGSSPSLVHRNACRGAPLLLHARARPSDYPRAVRFRQRSHGGLPIQTIHRLHGAIRESSLALAAEFLRPNGAIAGGSVRGDPVRSRESNALWPRGPASRLSIHRIRWIQRGRGSGIILTAPRARSQTVVPWRANARRYHFCGQVATAGRAGTWPPGFDPTERT
jgi:hypothetical protein